MGRTLPVSIKTWKRPKSRSRSRSGFPKSGKFSFLGNFSQKSGGWKQGNLGKAFFGMNFNSKPPNPGFFPKKTWICPKYFPKFRWFSAPFSEISQPWKHQFLPPPNSWKIGSVGYFEIIKAIKGPPKSTFFMEF